MPYNINNFSFLNTRYQAICKTTKKTPTDLITNSIAMKLLITITIPISAIADIFYHSILLAPSFILSTCISCYNKKIDYLMFWQHINRIQNTMIPMAKCLLTGWKMSINDLHKVMTPVDVQTMLSIIESTLPTPVTHTYSYLKNAMLKINSKSPGEEPIFSEDQKKSVSDIISFKKVHCLLNTFNQKDLQQNNKKNGKDILVDIITHIIVIPLSILYLIPLLLFDLLGFISQKKDVALFSTPFLMFAIFKNIVCLIASLIYLPICLFKSQPIYNTNKLINSFAKKSAMFLLKSLIKKKIKKMAKNSFLTIPISTTNHALYLLIEKQQTEFNIYQINLHDIDIDHSVSTKTNITENLLFQIIQERITSSHEVRKTQDSHVKCVYPPNIHMQLGGLIQLESQSGPTCIYANLRAVLEFIDHLQNIPKETTKSKIQALITYTKEDFDKYYKNDGIYIIDEYGYPDIKTYKKRYEK